MNNPIETNQNIEENKNETEINDSHLTETEMVFF